MDLKKLNLVELSAQEMQDVTGGSFFGRVWNWIKEHLALKIFDYGETIETSGSAVGGSITVPI
ncbi:hypothetical protein CMU51_04205 [Elizabethkingia anophelis]|uniref:Bacteriocin n=1 Tax=Elizabethkingia anophelis TaxID=1117645 RepID=A0AAE4NXI7_9FLAO|nr:hypothetical protein [Elizabethkingia anophelis]